MRLRPATTLYQTVSDTYRAYLECISFESFYAGISAGDDEAWEDLRDMCSALVVVDTPTVPGACIPCEANPIGLVCRCKGGRKTGLCYHILFVTHMILKGGDPSQRKPTHNLKYMNQMIKGATKKGHRPKKVKDCLQKEDSSDDEATREEKRKTLSLKW